MDVELVQKVRRFNRTVTQRVGALNDAYLSRDRPLGQARVLWEIGPDGSDVRSLRARLDLDSGYLSRLLRGLEADGLVEVVRGGGDGRVRTARLTPAGLAERNLLDQRSDQLASSILAPLTPRQRDRLVTAMEEVERLLVASMVRVAVCDPRHRWARLCHQAYAEELDRRFEGGFDPARSRRVDPAELVPPAGLLLVATLHGEPVGCVSLRRQGKDATGEEAAEVKRMWVSPAVRGLGLGRRLLSDLETRAAADGIAVLRLDTNRALTEAISLYRSAGYQEIPPYNDEPYAHYWFEKRLSPPPSAPAPSAPASA